MLIIQNDAGVTAEQAGQFISGIITNLYTIEAHQDCLVNYPDTVNRWVINPEAGISSGVWEQGLADGYVFVDNAHGVLGFEI